MIRPNVEATLTQLSQLSVKLLRASDPVTVALPVVDVPAVAGAHDDDHKLGFEQIIDDPVITDPDAPRGLFTDELCRPMRARVVHQALDGS